MKLGFTGTMKNGAPSCVKNLRELNGNSIEQPTCIAVNLCENEIYFDQDVSKCKQKLV